MSYKVVLFILLSYLTAALWSTNAIESNTYRYTVVLWFDGDRSCYLGTDELWYEPDKREGWERRRRLMVNVEVSDDGRLKCTSHKSKHLADSIESFDGVTIVSNQKHTYLRQWGHSVILSAPGSSAARAPAARAPSAAHPRVIVSAPGSRAIVRHRGVFPAPAAARATGARARRDFVFYHAQVKEWSNNEAVETTELSVSTPGHSKRLYFVYDLSSEPPVTLHVCKEVIDTKTVRRVPTLSNTIAIATRSDSKCTARVHSETKDPNFEAIRFASYVGIAPPPQARKIYVDILDNGVLSNKFKATGQRIKDGNFHIEFYPVLKSQPKLLFFDAVHRGKRCNKFISDDQHDDQHDN